MQTFRLLYRGPGQTWSICRSLLATGLCRSRGRALRQFWLQVVAAIIGVKSSNALRINSRCTWRHREGARHVYHTAIRRALSPLHSCESVMQTSTADPEVLHRSGTLSRSGTTRWRTREVNGPIASPFHGMRCPLASPIFASWPWLLHTGCSLETIDMTVC